MPLRLFGLLLSFKYRHKKSVGVINVGLSIQTLFADVLIFGTTEILPFLSEFKWFCQFPIGFRTHFHCALDDLR